MNSGMWFVVVIPVVIAFVFSVWVTISIMADVSDRARQSELKYTVGHVVKMKVPPPTTDKNNR